MGKDGEEGRGTSTLLVMLREGPGEGRVDTGDMETEGEGAVVGSLPVSSSTGVRVTRGVDTVLFGKGRICNMDMD